VTVDVERVLDMSKARYITILPTETCCHATSGAPDTRVYSAAPVQAQPDGGNQGSGASSNSNTSTDQTVSSVASKVKVTAVGYGQTGQTTTVDASTISATFAIAQGTSYADLTKTVYDDGSMRNQALSQAGALQFAGLLADASGAGSLEVMDVTNKFIVDAAGQKAYAQTDLLNTKTDAKDAVNKVGVIPIVNVDKDLQPTTIPAGFLTTQAGLEPIQGQHSDVPLNGLVPRTDSSLGGPAASIVPNPAMLNAGTQINKYSVVDSTGAVVPDVATVSNQFRLWYSTPNAVTGIPAQTAVTLRTQPDPLH